MRLSIGFAPVAGLRPIGTNKCFPSDKHVKYFERGGGWGWRRPGSPEAQGSTINSKRSPSTPSELSFMRSLTIWGTLFARWRRRRRSKTDRPSRLPQNGRWNPFRFRGITRITTDHLWVTVLGFDAGLSTSSEKVDRLFDKSLLQHFDFERFDRSNDFVRTESALSRSALA